MNKLSCLLLALLPSCLFSQPAAPVAGPRTPAFTVVPLGVKGGLDESNLSAYMVAPAGSNDYICLDAGTVYTGIQRAVDAGIFHLPVTRVLRQYIKGYLISH